MGLVALLVLCVPALAQQPPPIINSKTEAAAVAAIERNPPVNPIILVRALIRLSIAHENEGEGAAHEATLRRALATGEPALGLSSDPMGEVVNRLAALLSRRGRHGEAAQLYRRKVAEQAGRTGGDPFALAQSYVSLAYYVRLSGPEAEAARWETIGLDTIIERFDRLPDNYLPSMSQLACSQAIQQPERARRILEHIAPRLAATRGGGDDYALTATSCIAATYAWQGDSATAKLRLLPVIEALAREPARERGYELLQYLGTTINRLPGAHRESEIIARALLASIAKVRGTRSLDYAGARRNLAVSLILQGRIDEGEREFRAALALYEALLGGQSSALANEEANLVRYLSAYGRHAAALELSRTALARSVAEGRYAIGDGAQRVAQDRIGFYARYLMTAASQAIADRPDRADSLEADAFLAAQRTYRSDASRAFGERAAGDLADRQGAGVEFRRWQTARAAIAAHDVRARETLNAGASTEIDRSSVLAKRVSLEADLTAAQSALAARIPRLFSVLALEPVAVEALRASLASDEAMILVGPGYGSTENGHVFAVTREGFAWVRLSSSRDTIEALANEMAVALGDPRESGATRRTPDTPLNEFRRFDRARAFTLYRTLFGAPDIARLIASKPRWTIVPQGKLLSLPFAALPVAVPPGGAEGDVDPAMLRATRWLGIERTIAIVPSVAALKLARQPRPSVGVQRFFGIGDPAFRGIADPPLRDPRESGLRGGWAAARFVRSGAADLAALATLPRLPQTGPEVRALAALMHARDDDVLVQLDAREAALRLRSASGRLRSAQVIAFATHGLIAGDLGGSLVEPALALTPPAGVAQGRIDATDDGLLTASEIAGLDLSADLAILSACDTAAGSGDSEGLSGLARAFLFAGARSLIVSYFPVDDEAGRRLTTSAVAIIVESRGQTAEAMRKSMMSLMADRSRDAEGSSFAHPAHWAPFAVIDPQ